MNEYQKETISLGQLFILIVVFLLGTTIILARGAEAKQDYWMAELLGIFLGLCFLALYLYLLHASKGKNLYEILEGNFGKKVGKVFIFTYTVYFLYQASRITRDGTELLKITILPETPIEVTAIAIMFVIGYTLYLGIEVLARLVEILAPYFLIFFLLIGAFLVFSEAIDLTNFQPMLAEGFNPILTSLPTMLTFPYGELVVFTILFSMTSRVRSVSKVGIVGYLVSGILLVYADFIIIGTLGAEMSSRTLYPLLAASREVNLLQFFERADILVVFILMTGVFLKVAIYFFIAIKGVEHLFGIPYRQVCFPLAFLVPLVSSLVAKHLVEHNVEGLEVLPYFVHIPFQLVIPLLVLLVLIVKKKQMNKKVLESGI
ncbi:GerAB/ArcD/ProY family transporter [Halalkalibacter urbisdiaboli]|uniref:GerAB/ArcD/ProY family transporter n=1 Tax=Halalkalibacter urbisdiaboli TaxID=1960589 RepID=UPI000B441417|nr:endospore germination permease [Halalkalibacter urbisdiaboli]